MTDAAQRPNRPTIPPALRPFILPLGKHRKALKCLHFGKWKTWKSYTLAGYPSPKVVVGGGGITPYLRPDSGDVPFDAEHSPDLVMSATELALKNQDYFKSIVYDDSTNVWAYWMEGFAEKLKLDDIQAKDWRHIKGPLKKMQRQLDHSGLHVGFGAHLKDVEYGEDSAGSSEKKKLNVRSVIVPEIEKNFPYVLDLAFFHETLRDSKDVPKPAHKLTFYFGRVPRNLVKEMRIGKSWDFIDQELKNPWDEIVAPLLPVWEDGAAEHLGIDPDKADLAVAEMAAAAEDMEVGTCLSIIGRDYADIGAFRTAYEREVVPLYMQIRDTKRRAIVDKAKDERKAALLEPSREGGK